MSNFFDKIKQGVSDTSAKAKLAVEVQRLKGQISNKTKDMNGKFFDIGKLTYEAFKADDFASVSSQLESLCGDVTAIQAEIDQIKDKIKELESEGGPEGPGASVTPAESKGGSCTCGATVTPDTKFCPECGNKLF